MFFNLFLAAPALALLFIFSTVNAQGLYSKGSAVLQVDGNNYDKLITQSNLVSVRGTFNISAIEFLVCNR